MNKFGKISIISAALALPLTLLVSGIVAWYLKSSNPDGVDITYALAYRPNRPITCASASTWSFIAATTCALVAFGLSGSSRSSAYSLK